MHNYEWALDLVRRAPHAFDLRDAVVRSTDTWDKIDGDAWACLSQGCHVRLKHDYLSRWCSGTIVDGRWVPMEVEHHGPENWGLIVRERRDRIVVLKHKGLRPGVVLTKARRKSEKDSSFPSMLRDEGCVLWFARTSTAHHPVGEIEVMRSGDATSQECNSRWYVRLWHAMTANVGDGPHPGLTKFYDNFRQVRSPQGDYPGIVHAGLLSLCDPRKVPLPSRAVEPFRVAVRRDLRQGDVVQFASSDRRAVVVSSNATNVHGAVIVVGCTSQIASAESRVRLPSLGGLFADLTLVYGLLAQPAHLSARLASITDRETQDIIGRLEYYYG